jgi:MoxR-like ATPase
MEIRFSAETLDIINSIRLEIEKFNKNNPKKSVYISDRRWQNIAKLLKTAAHLCERKEVIPVDVLILRHCLWTLEENKEDLELIIESSIKMFGKCNVNEFDQWCTEYEDLDKGIKETFFYTEDIYDIEIINNKGCFPCTIEVPKHGSGYSEKIKVKFYIYAEYLETEKEFYPISENESIDERIKCNFHGGKTCSVSIDREKLRAGWNSGRDSTIYEYYYKFEPKIRIKKLTQKPVDPRTKKAFIKDCDALLESSCMIIVDSKSYLNSQNRNNENPFVPDAKRKIVTSSIESFIADLENCKLNAEHLRKKLDSYANTN